MLSLEETVTALKIQWAMVGVGPGGWRASMGEKAWFGFVLYDSDSQNGATWIGAGLWL